MKIINYKILLSIILAIALISIAAVLVLKTQFSEKKVSSIKLLDINLSALKVKDLAGGPAPCQPEFFDPTISKFYKIKQDGNPAESYKIEGYNDESEIGVMMIDGWYKEGEKKIILPNPFDVTVYQFGCASSFSFVLDLKKNGIRQTLYSHVINFDFSEDGKYLYLVDNTNNAGKWLMRKRIINIETQAENEIPDFSCVSDLDSFWQGEKLLTYSETSDADKLSKKFDYTTDICIWSKTGTLFSRISANMAWGAANRDFLAEKMGLLPNEENTFFAYTSKDDNACSLFLLDTKKQNRLKIIDILDKNDYPQDQVYYCADHKVEFDFNKVYFNSGTLKYRIEKWVANAAEYQWNSWKEVSF